MNCRHTYDQMDALAQEVYARVLETGARYYPEIEDPDGLKFLDSGMERMGFLLDCEQHVLKVSYNDNWQTCNEIETWQQAQDIPELKALLCPIVMWDDRQWWELMDYAPALGNFPGARRRREHMQLEQFLNTEYNIGDLHSGNVGYLNNQLIAIDYGYPHRGLSVNLGAILDEKLEDREFSEWLSMWGN